jgi:hypothetical protein
MTKTMNKKHETRLKTDLKSMLKIVENGNLDEKTLEQLLRMSQKNTAMINLELINIASILLIKH